MRLSRIAWIAWIVTWIVFSTSSAIGQQCPLVWDTSFVQTGPGSGSINAMEVFDHGTGPQLYVGGSFGSFEGMSNANSIARWNGQAWSKISTGFMNASGNAGTINSLYHFPNGGSLYAGGTFTVIGTASGTFGCRNFAALSSFGNGWACAGHFHYPPGNPGGTIHAISSRGNNLWVGGNFTRIGLGPFPLQVNSIAFRPIGGEWTNPNGGLVTAVQGGHIAGWVYELHPFENKMWAGGSFSHFTNSLNANCSPYIAHYSPWTNPCSGCETFNCGFSGTMRAFTTFDDGSGPALFISFSLSNGNARVRKWNGGTTWATIGTFTGGAIRTMEVFNDGFGDALYVGGHFTHIGSLEVNGVARWDGTSWSSVGPGVTGGSVNALKVFDDGTGSALYVAGTFTTAGGQPAPKIARLRPSTENYWTNPVGGTYHEPANWSCGLVPFGHVEAIIDNTLADYADTAFGVFLSDNVLNHRLFHRTDQVTLNLLNSDYTLDAPPTAAIPSLVIGEIPNKDPRLTIRNTMNQPSTFSASAVSIADEPQSKGRLTVRGSNVLVDAAGDVVVGREGDGMLFVEDGGEMQYGILGSSFIIGDAGHGVLTVQPIGGGPGGLLYSAKSIEKVVIAREPEVQGDVFLTGTSSLWSNQSANFYVGDQGYAALSILGGAQLETNTSSAVMLAREPGSSAQVTISGIDSAWSEFNQAMIIGGEGEADVLIANGGALHLNQGLTLAENVQSEALLSIEDGGAVTFGGNELRVGDAGYAEINIASGGTLSSPSFLNAITLGRLANSSGHVALTGPGSAFNATALNFRIGESGDASISVNNGASVNTQVFGELSLARLPGSAASVVIDGGTWSNTGSSFLVGRDGDASLIIANGGSLITDSFGPVTLSVNPGSSATVEISGGSTWTEFNQPIMVGGQGPASISMADGAINSIFLTNTKRGDIAGSGTIAADLFSLGTLRPANELTVQGDYRQIGSPDGGLEESGQLHVRVGGDALAGASSDQLIVTGTAELGGGLFIELMDGYQPQPGEMFSVLSASAIDPQHNRFDVAFMPGLPSQDGQQPFMRVAYGGGVAGEGGVAGVQGATVVVDVFDYLLGFEDPFDQDVDGSPNAVIVGDFDNNGSLDLAIALDGSPGSVLALYNDGTGAFVDTLQVSVGTQPSAITMGDFTNNGFLDLAVTNRGSNNVSILSNTGTEFSSGGAVSVGLQPSAIDAADLHTRGAIDLVVANEGSNNIMILENSGSGAFALSSTVMVGNAPSAISIEDIENTKSPGIVVANRDSNSVSILSANGSGVYAVTQTHSVGAEPIALSIEDIENTKSPGIITANRSGSISVLRNLGGGVFAPQVSLPMGGEPLAMTAFDMDEDGDPDFAIVVDDPEVGSVVRILRNDSPGSDQIVLAHHEDLAQGEGAALVASGDVLGDGADDLITINALGGGGGAASTNSEGGIAGDRGGKGGGSIAIRPNLLGKPVPVTCPGDITGGPKGQPDGIVNGFDLLALLGCWGPVEPGCESADLTGGREGKPDGTVDGFDLLALLSNWGPCPR